jgi:hypothetical protein
MRRGNGSGSTNGVSGGWSRGLVVPVIPDSLAGPRRARRRLSLVVASFDPDRVSRHHAIGVMCADSLVSRHVPPVCVAPPRIAAWRRSMAGIDKRQRRVGITQAQQLTSG